MTGKITRTIKVPVFYFRNNDGYVEKKINLSDAEVFENIKKFDNFEYVEETFKVSMSLDDFIKYGDIKGGKY